MMLLEELLPIFRDIFDDENLILTKSTSAKDIEGWDSLAHIRLIVAIEKFYNLRFTALEISELENVGGMIELIKKKNV